MEMVYCIDNENWPVSLEVGKAYPVVINDADPLGWFGSLTKVARTTCTRQSVSHIIYPSGRPDGRSASTVSRSLPYMPQVRKGLRNRLPKNAKEVAEQIGTGWRQHHHYTEESATGFEVMVCPDHTDEQAFNWYERRMMRLALEY